MNNLKKYVQQIVFVGVVLLLGAIYPQNIFAGDKLVTITILHTNDIHSHIDAFPSTDKLNANKGGMARLAGMIEKVRAENPNTLVFDAGDTFQGTPYFNYFHGELIYKIMSEIGYDAGTIGNHEFDNGLETIKESMAFAKFPLICSNYDFSNTILKDAFPRYKIFIKQGVRIGVYALGIEMQGLVSKKNYLNTQYLDPVKTALEMERFLKKQKHCDLIICLSHLGIEYKSDKVSDKVIAQKTHYTDMIVGGHTHTFLDKPIETTNADGRLIIINQAGFGGLVLGRADFVVDLSKKEKIKFETAPAN